MFNKDKRSLILLLALGDGCLHYIKNNGTIYGGLTIDHGIDQADYQKWKAQMLSEITGRDVKVRTGHKGKSIQVSVWLACVSNVLLNFDGADLNLCYRDYLKICFSGISTFNLTFETNFSKLKLNHSIYASMN